MQIKNLCPDAAHPLIIFLVTQKWLFVCVTPLINWSRVIKNNKSYWLNIRVTQKSFESVLLGFSHLTGSGWASTSHSRTALDPAATPTTWFLIRMRGGTIDSIDWLIYKLEGFPLFVEFLLLRLVFAFFEPHSPSIHTNHLYFSIKLKFLFICKLISMLPTHRITNIVCWIFCGSLKSSGIA